MAAVLNAERLEVSVDGLTLSPDPEERPGAEGAPLLPPPLPPPSPPGAGRGPGAAGQQPEPGEAAAGGAAEEARRLEQRWGFGLEELYGLALRFFKGEPARPRPRGGRPAEAARGPSVTGPRRPERAASLAGGGLPPPKFVPTRRATGSHTSDGPGPASPRLPGRFASLASRVSRDRRGRMSPFTPRGSRSGMGFSLRLFLVLF